MMLLLLASQYASIQRRWLALIFLLLIVSCNQQITPAGALTSGASNGGLTGGVTAQQLQATNLKKCLAAPDAVQEDVQAVLEDCSTSSSQLWTLSGSSASLTNGFCLTAKDGQTATGTPLTLETCKQDADPDRGNQNFALTGKNLVWGGRNMCVQMVDNGSGSVSLQLYPCNWSAAEQAFDAITPAGVAGIGIPDSIATTAGYTTSKDLSSTLEKVALSSSDDDVDASLTLDPGTTYQTMTGFGASMTDSSSYLIGSKMNGGGKDALMSKLFDPDAGIGLTLMRQPMGASDFSSVGNFSYDDSQNDTSLNAFTIEQDLKYTVPLLKEAKKISPSLFILAVPWSAPAWMKNNNSMNGAGNAGLKTTAYDSFAQYFVKTYQAYQTAGVTIDAFAPQNEPLNAQGGYPTMSFNAPSEATFIGSNLGPALKKVAPKAQIFGYDHNWDNIDYPKTLVTDATASPYVSAAAFHCYGGSASAMTTFHNQFPNQDIHMTECSGGTWQSDPFANTADLFFDSVNNWAKSVVLWNVALDPSGGPINGGCPTCRGVVTVDPDNQGKVTYNVDYYALGHFSKFVRPGAVRIKVASSDGSLKVSAFKNTNGSLVAVIYNTDGSAKKVGIKQGNKTFSLSVPGPGLATMVLAGGDAS